MIIRLLLLGSLLLSLGSLARASDTLTILIWEDYIAPDIVSQFEQARDVKVQQLTFDEEADIAPMLEKYADAIDLLVGNTQTLNQFRDQKKLLPLDKSLIPNAKRIHNRWQSDSDYVVPYMWGTTGIAWRTDKVGKAPQSWADLFQLAASEPGKVGLLTDPGEHLLAAHFALGNERDFTSVEEVAAAGAYLEARRELFRFVESDLSEDNPLARGDLIAIQAWNGDIAYLKDNVQDALDYRVPAKGCMIWQDSLAISSRSDNPALAHAFLEYLNKSQISARNAEYIGFASSNPMALLNASRDYLNNPIIRPAFEGLDHCQFYGSYPEDIQQAIEAHGLE